MSDKYFTAIANAYAPMVLEAAGDAAKLERALVLLAKDVERDTRQKAIELSNRLGHDIHNMRHD